jgi:tetratricopeptide (TPR) repeat protein
MRHVIPRYGLVLTGALLLTLILPLHGQYREYYFYGTVVDTQKEPLAGVEILLRDVETSRSYSVKTNKKGEFKLAGLPHGVYQVTFKKEGYTLKEDEWRFTTPQDTMQKVEIPPVTLVSEAVLQEALKMQEMQGAVKEAFEKIRQNDFDGALALLKDVLAENPDDPNALYLIGLSYSRKKMYPEAVAALTRVTELVREFAPAEFELAVSYQNLDEKDKALEHYRRTLELDPGNPDAAYNAGLILFERNEVDEALAHFEKALGLRPGDPAYLEMAGRCYINTGDFAKAIEYLEQAKSRLTDRERIEFLEGLIAKLKEQIKD